MSTGRNSLFFCVLVLATATILSGCGRKGNLEEPPSSNTVVETDENGKPVDKTKRKVPDRPFILDGLI